MKCFMTWPLSYDRTVEGEWNVSWHDLFRTIGRSKVNEMFHDMTSFVRLDGRRWMKCFMTWPLSYDWTVEGEWNVSWHDHFQQCFSYIVVVNLYWWWKPEYPEKTTDLSHVTDKFYHIMLYRVHLTWVVFELTTFVVIADSNMAFRIRYTNKGIFE